MENVTLKLTIPQHTSKEKCLHQLEQVLINLFSQMEVVNLDISTFFFEDEPHMQDINIFTVVNYILNHYNLSFYSHQTFSTSTFGTFIHKVMMECIRLNTLHLQITKYSQASCEAILEVHYEFRITKKCNDTCVSLHQFTLENIMQSFDITFLPPSSVRVSRPMFGYIEFSDMNVLSQFQHLQQFHKNDFLEFYFYLWAESMFAFTFGKQSYFHHKGLCSSSIESHATFRNEVEVYHFIEFFFTPWEKSYLINLVKNDLFFC